MSRIKENISRVKDHKEKGTMPNMLDVFAIVDFASEQTQIVIENERTLLDSLYELLKSELLKIEDKIEHIQKKFEFEKKKLQENKNKYSHEEYSSKCDSLVEKYQRDVENLTEYREKCSMNGERLYHIFKNNKVEYSENNNENDDAGRSNQGEEEPFQAFSGLGFQEEEYTPPSYEALFQGFPWSNFNEKYGPPTKSKLMLQDPEMSKNFENFIYDNVCPESILDIIKAREKLGRRAFNCQASKHLPRAILLHGPNGTGKSTLGVLIAKKLKTKLVFINSGYLGSMYRKSEEINLGEEIAPLLESGEPCVIVIDEADAIVGKGDRNDNVNRNRAAAVGQMMDMVKEKTNLILIWTTNHIDQIGAKFKDRNGICTRIKVGLPNLNNRRKILEYLITGAEKDSDKVIQIIREKAFSFEKKPFIINFFKWSIDFDSIVKKSDGFSIRNIEEILTMSFQRALNRLPKLTEEEMIADELATRTVVLTMQDFYEICDQIRKGLAVDKSAEFRKNLGEKVKKYGLVGAVVSLFGITIGAAINIFLNRRSQRYA